MKFKFYNSWKGQTLNDLDIEFFSVKYYNDEFQGDREYSLSIHILNFIFVIHGVL